MQPAKAWRLTYCKPGRKTVRIYTAFDHDQMLEDVIEITKDKEVIEINISIHES